MGLVRGDLTTVVLAGAYGKPRPAVILQPNFFAELDSVVVAPITSHLRPSAALFRKRIKPSSSNGLHIESDIMIDKISAVPRERTGKKIGHLHADEMAEITAAIALFLGF